MEFTILIAVSDWVPEEAVGRIVEDALEDYGIIVLEVERS